jgi:hypothetical protein
MSTMQPASLPATGTPFLWPRWVGVSISAGLAGNDQEDCAGSRYNRDNSLQSFSLP